jgi:predicted glycosyltransferase
MTLDGGAARRVLFYVQHLLGIGHLARASRIADALAANGFAVTLVTGGTRIEGFPGRGIDVVALPAIKSRDVEFSEVVDEQGHAIDEAFKERRRDRLLAAFVSLRPDVLMIEAYPFGRRQMGFELLPLLEAAAAAKPRPLIVCSIRDILQANRKLGRTEETASLVEQFFDLVMVHGDPKFMKLDESFPLATRIAGKVAYTGLVAPPPPAQASETFDAVVSCGGGAAAGHLLTAALGAAGRLGARLGHWCVITGPNPRAKIEEPVPPNVELCTFRSDFPALLSRARLSISQAGYNTVCDILRAKCRAVLVPFAGKEETEQTMRAQRLASLSFAQVVSEADLNVGRLVEAIERALMLEPPKTDFDLDGARATARLLQERVVIPAKARTHPSM